jgi:apolipoprotein N-acyltransferase
LGCSFPKAGLSFLAFGFLVPLLLALEGKRPLAVFRLFFFFSLLFYLIILYWIPRVMVKYGGTSWTLGIIGLVCLATFLSLISGVAGIGIGKIAARTNYSAVLWIPALWVAKDLVTEKIFGGFPWCLVGYTQYKNLYFVQLAEIGGIHLITFLLIALNVLIFKALKERDGKPLLVMLALLAGIMGGGYGLFRVHDARGAAIPRHQAGIIQPNSNHDMVFDFTLVRATLERLFLVSRELQARGAEFVVWPEFTVPIYPLQTPFYGRRFLAFSREYAPLLAGFTDFRGQERVYNSVILFQDGRVETYDKVHLTPFGEYVLFRRWLFFVKKITDEIGDFAPGKKVRNLDLAGHPLSTPICYEVIYPELVRSMIARGGELIVTISNDSWFGASSAPYQHLAMATFRSVENRRWLLRSTSNGISAVVDPAGRIVHQSPLHRPDQFLASFQYLKHKTIFTRWGYLFPYFCLLAISLNAVWIFFRKRKARNHQS